jgi:predicted O-methyltransferase YrrM
MNVESVKQVVKETKCMPLPKAYLITDLIKRLGIRDILELGHFHGVSTCYMAAALQEQGGGSITTIDLPYVEKISPSLEELLGQCGLSDLVTIYREPMSHTWRMMKMIEDGQGPRFDLVFIDDDHNWELTGSAFFMSDKLLRNGGWIIFDDLDWSYSSSESLSQSPRVLKMPEDYQTTCQVQKVFDLLVKQHPHYQNNMVHDGWGIAQKVIT